MSKSKILIIDGLNNFVRFLMVNTSISQDGEMIGGIAGFIKFLLWTNTTLVPTKIIIVWEKGGGNARRKQLYPEYKANRATSGLDKDVLKEINSDASLLKTELNGEDKIRQLLVLTRILKHLPVCQIYHPESECDDIIGYIVKYKFLEEDVEKIIVSGDKDFYQLLIPNSNKVKVYDSQTRKTVLPESVKERFGISSRNFCLARAVVGDDSDNIHGVNGIGLKTMAKRFPFLADDSVDYSVQQLIESCQKTLSGDKKAQKCFQSIIDGEEIIKRNWQLMYLDTFNHSASQLTKIDSLVDNFVPEFNKINFLREFMKSGLSITTDMDRLLYDMRGLIPKKE